MNERNGLYIAELEKAIKNNCTVVSDELLETFQRLLTESTNIYFQAYFENNFEDLEQLLQEQRSLRRILTNEIRKYSNQSIVLYTKMVQTYNIFNKLVQNAEKKSDFAERVALVEKRFNNAKAVLAYLYRHVHVQHKELVQNLTIRPSTLSDLLSELKDIGCVEKIESGRCSFYNLTNDGRKYLKDIHPDIDQKFDIGREDFREEIWENIKEKQKLAYMTKSNFFRKKDSNFEVIAEIKWGQEESPYATIG